MPNHPNNFSIQDLTAGYRNKKVLHQVNCTFPSDSITGLLGPNGAGKSTLLQILATIAKPKSGEVHIGGLNPEKRSERNHIRRELGYLPQNFTADDRLSIIEFVEYNLWMREQAKAQRRDSALAAIEAVGLIQSANEPLKSLSGGMRQRAGIAACIAGNPQFLLLDEPTAGLDPEQRHDFRQLLKQLKAEYSPTIIMSTHLVEDIVSSADHIVVLNEGVIRHTGSADILTASGDHTIDAIELTYKGLLRKSSAQD